MTNIRYFSSLSHLLAIAALTTLVMAPADHANALGVSPTQIEMTTTGAGSRGQVVVRNDGAVPLPVEATLQRFALDENGARKNLVTREDFLVFPPQVIIPPNGTQVFRVQWVGEPMLAKSESYMLSISQMPVKAPKGRSAVQVALSFGVLINVAPPSGVAQLKLVDATVATDQKGRRVPAITVHNPSNVHALLPQSAIRLTAQGWAASLTPSELSERMGIGLVQPGQRRRFLLPLTVPGNVRTLEANLDFVPARR